MVKKRIKVYLDTSVISYLQQEDCAKQMEDTHMLWRRFEENVYDVYLSQVTLNEIEKCPEPKRSLLQDYLSNVDYTKLLINEEVDALAQKIVDMGILTAKSFDDCLHIAAAVVNNCDCIASWNFKHIVNIKTIHGIRAVANLENYKSIDIVSPTVLLEGDNDYEGSISKS